MPQARLLMIACEKQRESESSAHAACACIEQLKLAVSILTAPSKVAPSFSSPLVVLSTGQLRK